MLGLLPLSRHWLAVVFMGSILVIESAHAGSIVGSVTDAETGFGIEGQTNGGKPTGSRVIFHIDTTKLPKVRGYVYFD